MAQLPCSKYLTMRILDILEDNPAEQNTPAKLAVNLKRYLLQEFKPDCSEYSFCVSMMTKLFQSFHLEGLISTDVAYEEGNACNREYKNTHNGYVLLNRLLLETNPYRCRQLASMASINTT